MIFFSPSLSDVLSIYLISLAPLPNELHIINEPSLGLYRYFAPMKRIDNTTDSVAFKFMDVYLVIKKPLYHILV